MVARSSSSPAHPGPIRWVGVEQLPAADDGGPDGRVGGVGRPPREDPVEVVPCGVCWGRDLAERPQRC